MGLLIKLSPLGCVIIYYILTSIDSFITAEQYERDALIISILITGFLILLTYIQDTSDPALRNYE